MSKKKLTKADVSSPALLKLEAAVFEYLDGYCKAGGTVELSLSLIAFDKEDEVTEDRIILAGGKKGIAENLPEITKALVKYNDTNDAYAVFFHFGGPENWKALRQVTDLMKKKDFSR